MDKMQKKGMNKKGMSVIIGYVLLITFGIVLAAIVFTYLKTFVPSEATQCPEGTSLFVSDYSYSCSTNQFNLTLKNNGKFNLQGYFIHATKSSNQTLATINLAKYYFNGFPNEGINTTTAVYFHTPVNKSLAPGENSFNVFNLDPTLNSLYSIEIIPGRFQTEGSTQRFVSCGGAEIREVVSCS